MGKIKLVFYVCAILLIIIPIAIGLGLETKYSSGFSEIFSQTVVGLAILCIISGKAISLFQKKKQNQKVEKDIGVIIGLFIVFILNLF